MIKKKKCTMCFLFLICNKEECLSLLCCWVGWWEACVMCEMCMTFEISELYLLGVV